MYKLGLEKEEEPEIKLLIFVGSWRKQGRTGKTSTSALLSVHTLHRILKARMLKSFAIPFSCGLREIVKGREAWHAVVHEVTKFRND